MTLFIWAKMQAAGGETLDQIVARKEAERAAGASLFWWGIGTSLGAAIENAAGSTGGSLPILFSKMISNPKKQDSAPASVCVWNGWRSHGGSEGTIPPNVLVTGGSDPSKAYYSLVCRSDAPLGLHDHGPFDPKQCRTMLGKVPGASQVTSLLRDVCPGGHRRGQYRWGFRAVLTAPWCVRLTQGRTLSENERGVLRRFKAGDDWARLTEALRRRTSN